MSVVEIELVIAGKIRAVRLSANAVGRQFYLLTQITHCGRGLFWYAYNSFLRKNQQNQFMSQHPSLRAASTLGGKRNVLKRFERTALLKKRGQWKEGDKITNLRKTKPDA